MTGAQARDRGLAFCGSKWEGSMVSQGIVESVGCISK
jgi:hypothetical protein